MEGARDLVEPSKRQLHRPFDERCFLQESLASLKLFSALTYHFLQEVRLSNASGPLELESESLKNATLDLIKF